MKQSSIFDSLCKKKNKQDQQPIKTQERLEKSVKIEKSAQKQPSQSSSQNTFLSQFTDATPKWALPEYCLDGKKRPRDHPDYDPTTLHVPEGEWSKFTAPMRQFWKIKSQNFDKVILFKLGKFYELFYDDAAIGNQYLELKYMGTKMHTGFPQKSLERYSNELVSLGFKTVIVQQMETPAQMNQRVLNDKKQGRKSQKTISRQVTQILTKGTVPISDSDQNYMPNYLISIQTHGNCFAFSLLEINTNEILMGTVESFQKFKTVLYQTRPVEAIYDPDTIPHELVQMMSDSFLHMQLSKIFNKNNLWHPLNAQCQFQSLEKSEKLKKPKIFSIIDENFSQRPKDLLYGTLSGLFQYLKNVFKYDYVIGVVRFAFYEKDTIKNMVLDSQALQHLEIFQTSEGANGSLFSNIDRTNTKFGKRLLRRWITLPLLNTFHIQQRLNALEDLEKFSIQRKNIGKIFKSLPDLEKLVNKLYHYAVKTTSASKAIYFEDVNTARLKQYRMLLSHLQSAWNAVRQLSKHSQSFKSFRLKQLVTLSDRIIDEEDVYYEDEDDQSCYAGVLPDIMNHLNQFDGYVKWQDDKPVPQKGLVSFFDELKDQQSEIKEQLQNYLEKIRRQMKQPNLKFAHTKQRYQIQIPEISDKRKPQNFEFSSKKAHYSRYTTPTTKKLVKNLQEIEESIKEQMGLFIGFFFEQFRKKQHIWQRFIEIIAEIDCLISLSEYSFFKEKVRPSFEDGNFEIKGAKHPCLLNLEFIPNDIVMKNKVILLTGPNMGGKSTILRTTCLLTILAQIGCYVPAQSYNCETIDRIFTRIGASDRLQLGKSTFFIEMQETRSVVMNGTTKSLAIIDELGRGTSTFDGMAIAYSVLSHIVSDINCYCLFATHYHSLVDEFGGRKGVSLMKMDCEVRGDKIMFLYRLTEGHVPKSFGLNVARSVGINSQTIGLAQRKAKQMHEEIERKKMQAIQKLINSM